MERRGGHSYCEVRIETGRTHQIRVHAQHIGHPVAGDDKYGDPDVNKRLREQVGLKRLFLHAASMEFALDDGRVPYVLNAPLASELVVVLDRSEEHTYELQSLMRISYAVFCLKKKTTITQYAPISTNHIKMRKQ